MIKTFAFLVLASIFAMGAFAIASPQRGTVQAHEEMDSPVGCSQREVALDEGYGVTRVGMRIVCER